MINTINPPKQTGHDDVKGEVLERIRQQYARPDEKQREATKKLGKDEFFKIMVTQIQHQDPLKPYQNEQMAAQMAQFTSLEQMVNVNQNLEKLAQAQQPLQNMGAANLIGKFVTADSSRIVHTEGRYTELSFDLPADAAKARLVLLNDRGETVRELEATNLKKGLAHVSWDGKKTNNMPATSGQYLVQITATTEDGKPIQVQTQKTDVVHGVSFEGKETILLVGDLKHPQKMPLKNVFKIVDRAELKNVGPQISGLPPGLEIGGLENILGPNAVGGNVEQAEAAGGFPNGVEPTEDPPIAQDRMVEGYVPGLANKFAPLNAAAFRKAQEKPEVQPQNLSPDEIRHLLAEGPDLSESNPAAAAVKAGLPLPGGPAKDSAKTIEAVNPAAKTMGYNAAVSAPRQSMPSGTDGSTAGQWSEE